MNSANTALLLVSMGNGELGNWKKLLYSSIIKLAVILQNIELQQEFIMTNKNYNTFRQNYENNISKKLEIEKEKFYDENYETKQPFGLAIVGFIMFFYGLYVLLKIQLFYGLFVIIPSLFFIYGGLKKPKLVFRISKNGIWTKEFGFIYFRHIDRFEFYRYVGKHSSERLKIYIKNYKLYQMVKPYLEQGISHIDNYEKLKNKLEGALTITNKLNESKNHR